MRVRLPDCPDPDQLAISGPVVAAFDAIGNWHNPGDGQFAKPGWSTAKAAAVNAVRGLLARNWARDAPDGVTLALRPGAPAHLLDRVSDPARRVHVRYHDDGHALAVVDGRRVLIPWRHFADTAPQANDLVVAFGRSLGDYVTPGVLRWTRKLADGDWRSSFADDYESNPSQRNAEMLWDFLVGMDGSRQWIDEALTSSAPDRDAIETLQQAHLAAVHELGSERHPFERTNTSKSDPFAGGMHISRMGARPASGVTSWYRADGPYANAYRSSWGQFSHSAEFDSSRVLANIGMLHDSGEYLIAEDPATIVRLMAGQFPIVPQAPAANDMPDQPGFRVRDVPRSMRGDGPAHTAWLRELKVGDPVIHVHGDHAATGTVATIDEATPRYVKIGGARFERDSGDQYGSFGFIIEPTPDVIAKLGQLGADQDVTVAPQSNDRPDPPPPDGFDPDKLDFIDRQVWQSLTEDPAASLDRDPEYRIYSKIAAGEIESRLAAPGEARRVMAEREATLAADRSRLLAEFYGTLEQQAVVRDSVPDTSASNDDRLFDLANVTSGEVDALRSGRAAQPTAVAMDAAAPLPADTMEWPAISEGDMTTGGYMDTVSRASEALLGLPITDTSGRAYALAGEGGGGFDSVQIAEAADLLHGLASNLTLRTVDYDPDTLEGWGGYGRMDAPIVRGMDLPADHPFLTKGATVRTGTSFWIPNDSPTSENTVISGWGNPDGDATGRVPVALVTTGPVRVYQITGSDEILTAGQWTVRDVEPPAGDRKHWRVTVEQTAMLDPAIYTDHRFIGVPDTPAPQANDRPGDTLASEMTDRMQGVFVGHRYRAIEAAIAAAPVRPRLYKGSDNHTFADGVAAGTVRFGTVVSASADATHAQQWVNPDPRPLTDTEYLSRRRADDGYDPAAPPILFEIDGARGLDVTETLDRLGVPPDDPAYRAAKASSEYLIGPGVYRVTGERAETATLTGDTAPRPYRVVSIAAEDPVDRLQALAAEPVVNQITTRFAQAGFPIYLVGGAVRDSVSGTDANDIDITTPATPDQTSALLDPIGAVYPLGIEHGTVVVNVDGQDYEVTTHRTERYDPGSRSPITEFTDDLDADLARRDFTFNAMAYDPSRRRLIDPHDGQADLAAGIVRAVGDPDERFNEDPLRIIRAARFAAVNGWTIDPATEAAAARQTDRLAIVSNERVNSELDKILKAPRPAAVDEAWGTAKRIGFSDRLFGPLSAAFEQPPPEGFRPLREVRPDLRLAALVARARVDPMSLVASMKRGRDEMRAISDVLTAARLIREGQQAAAVRRYDDDTLTAVAALTVYSEPMLAAYWSHRDALRAPLPVDGNDMKALGFDGPDIGAALARVEAEFLAADGVLTREAALEAARL